MLIAAAAASDACSSSESTAPANLSASWTGSFTNTGTATSLQFLLLDKSGSVTGNGTFVAGGTFAIVLSGTFINPDVSLTVSSPGFIVMNFTGKLSGQTITGVLNGSGYLNQPVTFVKQ